MDGLPTFGLLFVLGSKVCGVENLPPLCMAQSVMAGVRLWLRFSFLKVKGRKRAEFARLT